MNILLVFKEVLFNRWTSFLLIVQISLVIIVLSNVALIYEDKAQSLAEKSGMPEEHILTLMVRQSSDDVDVEQQVKKIQSLLEDINGVEGVTTINGVPLSSGAGWQQEFSTVADVQADKVNTTLYMVNSAALSALDLKLEKGRFFEAHEVQFSNASDYNLPHLAIINKATEKRLFDDQSAVGKLIYMPEDLQNPMTVIGVVEELKGVWPKSPSYDFSVMVPRVDLAFRTFYMIRHERPITTEFSEKITSLINNEIKTVLVERVNSLKDVKRKSFQDNISLLGVLNFIALILVLLTLSCVFVISFFEVKRQKKNVAIKFSLGYSRKNILGYFLWRNILVYIVVVVISLPINIYASNYTSLLYGTPTLSWLELSSVVLLIGTVVIMATAFPSWLATKTEVARLLK